MLKQNVGFFSTFVLSFVNKSTSSSAFTVILKLENIIPGLPDNISKIMTKLL